MNAFMGNLFELKATCSWIKVWISAVLVNELAQGAEAIAVAQWI